MDSFGKFTVLLFTSLISHVTSAEYKDGEKVIIYVNKVGPYFNPHETYHYYQLPVCRPTTIEHKSLTLGEVLDGDRMALSMYDITYKTNVSTKKELCKIKYNKSDLDLLSSAIEDLYYFEFVIDDIPVRGFIGLLEEIGYIPHSHNIKLWAHLHFNIEYNGGHIIYANVSTREAVPLSPSDVYTSMEVAFTYSITWIKSELSYENRASRIKDDSFFPKNLEIHWLSIINSLVLVFLLIGFVIIIMARVLKSDFARYNLEDDTSIEGLDFDDNGWKIIRTDVFRIPPHINIFCAILGVGSQFLALATGILVMALAGMFNAHHHGSINSAAVVLYAFTSSKLWGNVTLSNMCMRQDSSNTCTKWDFLQHPHIAGYSPTPA